MVYRYQMISNEIKSLQDELAEITSYIQILKMKQADHFCFRRHREWKKPKQ